MRDQFLEKPLPSNPDAERAVLGGILLDNNLIGEVVRLLRPADFYSPMHRRVFDAMLKLHERSQPLDPILIGEELKATGSLESIGGIATIANLTFGIPHFGEKELLVWAKVVKDKSVCRHIVKTAGEIQAEALTDDQTPGPLIDLFESKMLELRNLTPVATNYRIGEIVGPAIDRVARRANSGGETNNLLTGFRDLDEMTDGLGPELVIIAGRPSMGKTSLANTIARNVAKSGKVVQYFSLEMTANPSHPEMAMRMLSGEAKVNGLRLKKGFLTREEWGKVAVARETLETAPLFIDDSPILTMLDVRARARRTLLKENGLDLIVIDHIGLVEPLQKEGTLAERLGTVSRAAKATAKEFGVPVILLSQLSRKAEERKPPRPISSDLRDSGNIEQDADHIWLLYREEYYGRTEENAGVAELIVSKNRNGPTGTVKLAFLSEYADFEAYYPNY